MLALPFGAKRLGGRRRRLAQHRVDGDLCVHDRAGDDARPEREDDAGEITQGVRIDLHDAQQRQQSQAEERIGVSRRILQSAENDQQQHQDDERGADEHDHALRAARVACRGRLTPPRQAIAARAISAGSP